MSTVDLNALVNGLSGKLGNAVLRKRGSKTLLTQKPKARETGLTEDEKKWRERFSRAVAYARAKMKDPAAKQEYARIAARKENVTAYNIAVKDYLKMPRVDTVKVDGYNGKAGDAIIIKAIDDFKIIAVSVNISQPDGTFMEAGSAVASADLLEWKYIATQTHAVVPGTVVKVIATDRAGNEVSVVQVL